MLLSDRCSQGTKYLACLLTLFTYIQPGQDTSLVRVRSPEYAILGQTVQLYCNFTLPPGNTNFYSLKWFLNEEEVYRLVPEAKRQLQRMVFSTEKLRIDIESSKMIGELEHLLVLQTVTRQQTGNYKCQVTMDAPPFQFIEASAHLTVMVLPERHPVISGLKKTTYLPGDKLSINCTSSPSYPSAKLSWFLNKKKVDRWMVTSFLPLIDQKGLESSTLGLNFLVLPEHFRGPEMELWATCKAAMPSIHGVELPIERTLLLGTLHNKLQYYQGGWAASGGGCRCDKNMLMLLLLMMMMKVTRTVGAGVTL